jgi:hypothetical protein
MPLLQRPATTLWIGARLKRQLGIVWHGAHASCEPQLDFFSESIGERVTTLLPARDDFQGSAA